MDFYTESRPKTEQKKRGGIRDARQCEQDAALKIADAVSAVKARIVPGETYQWVRRKQGQHTSAVRATHMKCIRYYPNGILFSIGKLGAYTEFFGYFELWESEIRQS